MRRPHSRFMSHTPRVRRLFEAFFPKERSPLLERGLIASNSLSALARRVAATNLRDYAGRARSALSSQRSASVLLFLLELLRKTQRSHRERVYPPALPPATDRTLPTAAHGVVGSPSFFSYRC